MLSFLRDLSSWLNTSSNLHLNSGLNLGLNLDLSFSLNLGLIFDFSLGLNLGLSLGLNLGLNFGWHIGLNLRLNWVLNLNSYLFENSFLLHREIYSDTWNLKQICFSQWTRARLHRHGYTSFTPLDSSKFI